MGDPTPALVLKNCEVFVLFFVIYLCILLYFIAGPREADCVLRVRATLRGSSLAWSILPSLGRKLLFVFPLTNAQLDLTKRKMLLNMRQM